MGIPSCSCSSSTLTSPIKLFLIYSLLVYCSNSTRFPISKPGCEDQERCGDVLIPYPFGTREGCALNNQFLIQCHNSSETLLAVENTSMVVQDISLEGNMRALYDLAYDCYDPSRTNRRHFRYGPWKGIGNLPGTLYYNNTANILLLIGCDDNATIQFYKATYNTIDLERSKYVEEKIRAFSCRSGREVNEDSCLGIGCYQTSIPNGAWGISVRPNRSYKHPDGSNFSHCCYIFLVQNSTFHFSTDNLTNIDKRSSFPVLLDWVVENAMTCKVGRSNETSYACKAGNSTCNDDNGAIGYRCRCQDGFHGNPYLDQGCVDINECADSKLHKCPKHSTCENMVGSHKCSCNPGYSKTDNSPTGDCIADHQQIQKNTNWPTFAVVSVAVGGFGFAVILGMSFCLYTRFQRRKLDKLKGIYFRKNGGFLLQQKVSRQEESSNNTKIFSVEELQKASNNFSENNVIGRGGFGTVFKGELMDNTKVAIKKATVVDGNQVEQFINEVTLLSQINNKNVVKLLGCCLETEIPLLVYEFIDNGTLYQHLHRRDEESKLSWNIRVRIATEVAGVLSYLHSVAFPPIIHRDIKSANILLDSDYTAKVSDFGISRIVPVGDNEVPTIVQGTPGYLDPEYLQTGMLTEKSDVYSFGILLIELLTGRSVFTFDRPEVERFLSNYFLSSLQNDRLIEIFDGKICCDENIEQLKETAMIAEKCISVKGENRPYMKEVVRKLEALETNTQQFQTSDISSPQLQPVGSANVDDEGTLKGSYSVSRTMTERMLMQIGGGR